MKTLLTAGVLTLAAYLAAGAAVLSLEDPQAQRGPAPYAVAKIGQPEGKAPVALASSSLPRR